MLEIAKSGANLVSDRNVDLSRNLGCALADFYGHYSSRDLHIRAWRIEEDMTLWGCRTVQAPMPDKDEMLDAMRSVTPQEHKWIRSNVG